MEKIMQSLNFLSSPCSISAWRGVLSYRDHKGEQRRSMMMVPLLALSLGIALGSLLGAPFPVAAATCDILKNKCGETKSITVSGEKFAGAVEQASQSHGKQPWKKIKGKCNVLAGGWVELPMVVTSKQKCEIKLLTGGKSHSKMKKRCAIKKWVHDKAQNGKDGVGGSWSVKILKKPKNNSRQKMWHVKLKNNRPPPLMYFEIKQVKLTIPASSSLTNSSGSNAIRDYCFQ
jgi:hypothetical protein